MQELLTVNERYHELLTISEGQRMDLEIAQTDLAQLRPALAEAEVRLFEQAEALDRAQSTAASLQASNDLLVAKNAALDAESADLHKVLKSYAAQLLESEAELTVTKQRNLEAEALLSAHWEAGYDEGKQQQQAEVKAKLRRAQQQARQQASEAFEHGKRTHAEETQSRRAREEAERRLLLRRAEEARTQQRRTQSALEEERQARETAAERSERLEERLKANRSHKEALAVELHAQRAAHSADLDHFEQMESALGRACSEFSSLAQRHAVTHAHALSPPRSRGVENVGASSTYGSSPPEAVRTRPPRPAAVYVHPKPS